MATIITLQLPNIQQPFTVERDAFVVAIGVVFSQANHPICFFSKKMCPHLQATSAYVKEMYAITKLIKKSG